MFSFNINAMSWMVIDDFITEINSRLIVTFSTYIGKKKLIKSRLYENSVYIRGGYMKGGGSCQLWWWGGGGGVGGVLHIRQKILKHFHTFLVIVFVPPDLNSAPLLFGMWERSITLTTV